MLTWVLAGALGSLLFGGFLAFDVLLIWQIMFRGRCKWFWLAGAIAVALSGALLGFAGWAFTSII